MDGKTREQTHKIPENRLLCMPRRAATAQRHALFDERRTPPVHSRRLIMSGSKALESEKRQPESRLDRSRFANRAGRELRFALFGGVSARRVFDEFEKDAARRLRVDERDQTTARAHARLLVYQTRALGLQTG